MGLKERFLSRGAPTYYDGYRPYPLSFHGWSYEDNGNTPTAHTYMQVFVPFETWRVAACDFIFYAGRTNGAVASGAQVQACLTNSSGTVESSAIAFSTTLQPLGTDMSGSTGNVVEYFGHPREGKSFKNVSGSGRTYTDALQLTFAYGNLFRTHYAWAGSRYQEEGLNTGQYGWPAVRLTSLASADSFEFTITYFVVPLDGMV